MALDLDERRVAIEAIATLVYIKNTMVELLLKPAGVPPAIYLPLLRRRDESTGYALSKRQIAPLILDAVEKRPDGTQVIRGIVEIAANWSRFDLAQDREWEARATVQKARAVLGTIQEMETREAEQHERARSEAIARRERERAEQLRRQSELLLQMFDALVGSADPQERGILLEDLMNRVFDLHEIQVRRSFRRNEGGEQIDGAFTLDGWHYLLECRWRDRLADIRQLDGLRGQIGRSGKQVLGLFLSVNGWSEHVVPLLKQNPEKDLVLMDGYDLRGVLSQQVDFQDFLRAKIAWLNLHAEPHLGLRDYLIDLAQERGG